MRVDNSARSGAADLSFETTQSLQLLQSRTEQFNYIASRPSERFNPFDNFIPRALPTAGGAWDANVEVTIKSLLPPPRAQCPPPVTGSREDTVYPLARSRKISSNDFPVPKLLVRLVDRWR